MVIHPQNPAFIFVSFFTPCKYFNTYIKIVENTVEFHRYFCRQNKIEKETVNFEITDVILVGFPSDLKIRGLERKLYGHYGAYVSQEIAFVLNDNRIIALNARPYTKKQIKNFLQRFPRDIVRGEQLDKVVGNIYPAKH